MAEKRLNFNTGLYGLGTPLKIKILKIVVLVCMLEKEQASKSQTAMIWVHKEKQTLAKKAGKYPMNMYGLEF